MLMLIWKNISRRRIQSVLTITITLLTVMVFVMVMGVLQTMNTGLENSRDRLGADAILVPKNASATGGDLLFAQRVCGKKNMAQVDELLKAFGLDDRADFFPHQLSGGQRRRAMAARCLIHSPKLILADEPTNDLDEHWSEEIVRLLKEQTEKGTGVVMVTHNSKWAQQASRRCRLVDGILTEI